MSRTERGRPLGQWIFTQFLLLLVVMTAPTFVLILLTTEYGFRTYVYQGDIRKAGAFAPLLEHDFQTAGSWQAVEPYLLQAPFSFHATLPGDASLHSDDPALDLDWVRERIVVLDTGRKVVLDSKHVLLGTVHPPEHLANAVVLQNSSGRKIGYLLVGTMVDPALTLNHRNFLSQMALTLVLVFLATLGLALPLAFWLGSRISRPLRTLVNGTRRAVAGDWSWSVADTAPREVQTLSVAFQKLGHDLRAAEDRKADLLADAAHELRTPLTVVRGTIEAMLDGVFPLERSTLEAVYSEALRLEKIVDSLRQLEDLHHLPRQPGTFLWKSLLDHVTGVFQAQAHEKGQTLHVACPDRASGFGEVEAVQQIAVNLVSNALRHAPGGNVWVEVETESKGSRLAVEDDGPGVPETQRERIFERFVRLDPSRSKKTGGRGLGLAIVRELVERHGGRVRVGEGRTGGARFEVWLPAQNPAV